MAIPKEHEHVPFLTQMIVLVSNLGFQSISEHYERPCICCILWKLGIAVKTAFCGTDISYQKWLIRIKVRRWFMIFPFRSAHPTIRIYQRSSTEFVIFFSQWAEFFAVLNQGVHTSPFNSPWLKLCYSTNKLSSKSLNVLQEMMSVMTQGCIALKPSVIDNAKFNPSL